MFCGPDEVLKQTRRNLLRKVQDFSIEVLVLSSFWVNKAISSMDLAQELQEVLTLKETTSSQEELKEIKNAVREKVWDLMAKNSSLKPYPPDCHGKIPNFRKSNVAAYNVIKLREYKNATTVKVNPSLAQMKLRELVMTHGKKLIVPAPSLSPNDPNGGDIFMNLLENVNSNEISKAATKKGAKRFGKSLVLEEWKGVKIDLYVVGSVAVTKKGVRLGKGLGYAELEWGILTELGVVDPARTVVLTTVSNDQIVADSLLPADTSMAKHDLPVDVIVTPESVFNVRIKLPKPTCGILWDEISDEKMKEIPILQKFKK